MLYCLIGKTCSGKDTALKQLIKLGYDSITKYTTRPIRENEIDGVDYNFITDKEYLTCPIDFVVQRLYNTWFYGVDPKDLNSELDQFIIIDPSGYRELKETFGDHHVTGLYLDVPQEVRLLRGLNRKDNVEELFRRLQADEKDFEGFEKEVDHVIQSLEKKEALDKILLVLGGTRIANA